jgi:isoleucyl-tRNA synthetase
LKPKPPHKLIDENPVNDETKEKGPDYKGTLNLPQTEFPMQANLASREPQALARWEEQKLYAQIQDATAGRTPYWFVDGPPYANGDIHIGHAVNKVLKDIVVKAARLDGCAAPFVPGWDCHGLPIELQVEKKFGKVGEKLDAAEFRAKCREYAGEQVERQRVDFKRLGILADWENPYLTMQPKFEAEQLRVLARIVDNGHVVRGFKPVHWCLDCGSSLAEAEVEYQDKQSTTVDVSFPVTDVAAAAALFGVDAAEVTNLALVAWTTTPWSLPGNQAISVHPELRYALAQFEGLGMLVVAEGLLASIAARWGLASPPQRLGHAVPGSALTGLTVRPPFAAGPVPVLTGTHVTLEAGTGLVHTAPAHGMDDFVVCQANGIAVLNPVGADGRYRAEVEVVGGIHLRKAEALIVDHLRTTGRLVHLAPITHSYPHCWRHKTPLVTLATPQWFMSMELAGLREAATKAIRETRWIPEWGEERILGMVNDRPDWCISRQRTWGVPLALLIHKQSQEKHPRTGELLHKIADAVEAGGLEAWFGSSVTDWLDATEADHYFKCTDTLDVWFDSGSVHQASFVATNPAALDAQGLAPQADLYLEGSDQHRGWFQSSLLTSVAMRRRAPYKAVLTHGFTVDEQGRKMSKSIGNVVAPQSVTKTLGADVLRLWVSSADYSGEIAISDNLLKRIADAYRRIRNTARFLLSNLHDFDPTEDAVPVDDMLAVDRWALSQAAALQVEIAKAYKASEFHRVYHLLHNYCVVDLGGLYLDILKDRLYTLPPKSKARRSAQTAMHHIAEALTRWIAPVLSFTADEIWPLLPGERTGSIFSEPWYPMPEAAPAGDFSETTWSMLAAIRNGVNRQLEALRAAKQIGSGLEATVTVYAKVDGDASRACRMLGDELRFWLITSQASVQPIDAKPADAIEAIFESGETIWLDVKPNDAPKCARCWHRRADVGQHAAHPSLCGRCIENIDGANGGDGERRHFI